MVISYLMIGNKRYFDETICVGSILLPRSRLLSSNQVANCKFSVRAVFSLNEVSVLTMMMVVISAKGVLRLDLSPRGNCVYKTDT